VTCTCPDIQAERVRCLSQHRCAANRKHLDPKKTQRLKLHDGYLVTIRPLSYIDAKEGPGQCFAGNEIEEAERLRW
jgi:hypothetical protein